MTETLDPEGAMREPWDLKKRVVPLKTWSGRVVHDRQRHFFRMRDVERIMLRIQPPEGTTNLPQWLDMTLVILRQATIAMLDRLLWFMTAQQVERLYDFCIDLIDRTLRIDMTDSQRSAAARRIIFSTADQAGLTVTIKKVGI